MKTVFSNKEIPHKWAHATQDHARGSNLSFQGDTLYSYSTPIARIYRRRRLDVLVLFSDHNYSATTAKHLSYARRATSHLTCVEVPRYVIGCQSSNRRYTRSVSEKDDHAANVAHLIDKLEAIHKVAGRAKQRRNVEWQQEEAEHAHKALADYLIFFGIRRKMPLMPSFAAALERAERIEKPDPVRDAKRFKAREQREARLAALIAGAAQHWRDTGGYPASLKRADIMRREGVLLRVDGADILTSMGARVPLAAAPMVWNLVQRARSQGGFEPTRALGRLKIGDYPLDRIDADGTLRAGCHVIPYAELELLAVKLGLAAA